MRQFGFLLQVKSIGDSIVPEIPGIKLMNISGHYTGKCPVNLKQIATDNSVIHDTIHYVRNLFLKMK